MNHDSNAPKNGQPSGGVAFGMTDMTVFRDRSLPPNVKLVYVALVGYVNRNTGKCWPSRELLAWDTGLSVRAVGRAVKQAEEAGLIWITHTQSSNVYTVRDFVGGYQEGSGPGGLTVLPGRSESLSRKAPEAHELDKRTRPVIETSTSSNAASGRHFAGSTTDRKIYIPRWLAKSDDRGAVAQYLVSAAVATMEADGLDVGDKAKDAMGYTLLHRCENLTNMQLAERAQKWVREAGADCENGWLGTWPQRRAS